MTTSFSTRARRETSLAQIAPFAVLVLGLLAMVVPSILGSTPLVEGNWYNVGQRVALLALPAAGLAVTMIAGEFDLSVPGSFLLGSVVAVKYGAEHPYAWMILAVLGLAVIGGITGAVIAYFEVNSICVTLGSYLVMTGGVYVISGDESLSFSNFDVGTTLTKPLGGILAVNVLIVAFALVLIGLMFSATRWGPQLRAVGSDRRSARTVGVKSTRMLVGAFAISAGVSALAGVIQGYSLAFAQPSTSTQLLSLAATCALVGGVSIAGGIGSVLGISCGVVAFACMEEALTRARVDEATADIVTGGLLLLVALVAAPELRDRMRLIANHLRLGPAGQQARAGSHGDQLSRLPTDRGT